jgi:hypothetical protein
MERGISGLLLVLGSASLIVAGILYGLISAGSTELALAPVKVTALELGFVLTSFGLAAFEFTLAETGARILARFSTIAFLAGAILWTVTEVINLDQGWFTSRLERDYVMLACFTAVAIGAIAFRTGMQPRWFGWTAVIWGVGDAMLYLLGIFPAPLGPNLVMLVLGVLLLRQRGVG